MMRRFFYHGFWNFYDYLGTLTLAGTLYALGTFAAIIAAFAVSSRVHPLVQVGLPALIVFIISVPSVAGLFYYTGKAARDEPARWADLVYGVRTHWKSVAISLGLWLLVEVVLLVNLNFYFHVQQTTSNGGLRIFLVGAMALVAWISAAWVLMLAPWLAASTVSDNREPWRTSLRRMALGVALTPGCWLVISLILLIIAASVVYLRITVIFLLPVMASLAQTVFQLGVQYSAFLVEARNELGIGSPLKKYKARANELALNWEHKQLKRTFKELVRPWEF